MRWLWAPSLMLAGLCPASADQYRSQQRIIESPSPAASNDPQTLLKQTPDPYQRALLLRELAGRAIDRKDYPAAAAYLEQTLAQKALAPVATEQLRQTLSRLYSTDGDNARNLPQLEAQMRAGNAGPETLVALGAAYVKAKRFKEAVPLLQRAVAAGAPANPNWERVLAVALMGAERYPEAVPVLEHLVRAAPGDRELWGWLCALSVRYGDKTRALALLQMALQLGVLDTQNDRLRFVQVSAQQGLPYQAASTLQAWIDGKQIVANASSLQTLASLWIAARESSQALATLDRAIQLAPRAELYRSKAQLLMRRQQYADAAAAQQKAIDLGDRSGAAWMTLALARYQQGELDQAGAAFTQARQHADQAQAAEQWLDYLDKPSPATR